MMDTRFCYIAGFKPSERTIMYIDEMNTVIKMSAWLERVIAIVPFFQIFAGRSSYDGISLAASGWNVTTYEWGLFQNSIMAIPEIKRRRLEDIAEKGKVFSTGNDLKFWRCVSNAL